MTNLVYFVVCEAGVSSGGCCFLLLLLLLLLAGRRSAKFLLVAIKNETLSYCAILNDDGIVFFCLFFFKGLADAFIKMRLPFESDEACKLNKDIFETIYFGAVNASIEVKRPLRSVVFGSCAFVVLFGGGGKT